MDDRVTPPDLGDAGPGTVPSSIVHRPSSNRDRRWAFVIAILTMALTMIPYLYGFMLQGANPRFGWFSWLGYNLDDSAVYMSWMRQAADGRFFQQNLFTTHPQIGHQFNVFFLLLGNIARFTHLPLIAVWHGARVVLGIALLYALYRLAEALLAEPRARRAAFLFLCFSAGFGWIPALWVDFGQSAPIDVWQTEAITFLCLYLNPLNIVSLLLMVGAIGGLLAAESRRSVWPALGAGLCGLLLGNVHGYDVVTLTAVWGGFLLVRMFVRGRIEPVAWGRALIAAIPTGVSAGYMLYLIKAEDVFAKRVAVPTLAAPPAQAALGFGLLVPLALFGIWLLLRARSFTLEARDRTLGPDAAILLVVWLIANVAVSYTPLPFQRKMLMGAHIPLCMLAGLAIWWIGRNLADRRWTRMLGMVVLIMAFTNARFLVRDVRAFQSDRAQSAIQRPYLYVGEVEALLWIRNHASADSPVQPLPWIARTPEGKLGLLDTTVAAFTPGLTGHPVHAGHWGETPDFGETMGLWRRFILPNTTDQYRIDLLRLTGVKYVVFSQKHDETGDPVSDSALLSLFRGVPPRCLRLIPEASNPDADVYEVSPYQSGSTSRH